MKNNHGRFIIHLFLIATMFGCATTPDNKNEEKLQSSIIELKDKVAALESEKTQLINEKTELAIQLDEIKTKVQFSENKKADAKQRQEEPSSTVVQAHPAIAFKAKPANKSVSSEFVNDESTDRFREALILFQSHKYSDAVVEFKDFVKNYGDYALAPRAQYLAGSSYFQQKEYKLAHTEWTNLITAYPNSSAIAETLAGLIATSKALKLSDEQRHFELKLNSRYAHAKVKIPVAIMPKAAAEESPQETSNQAAPANATQSSNEPTVEIKKAPIDLDEGEPE